MTSLQLGGMSTTVPSFMEKRKSTVQRLYESKDTPPEVPQKNHNSSSSILNGSDGSSLIEENESINHDQYLIRQRSRTMTLGSNLYIEPEYNIQLVLDFTPREISLIRDTWNEMLSDDLNQNLTDKTQTTSINHASIASSLFCIQFYANLLGMDPNLEKMFPSIKHQAISFSGVLSTAIINLENLKTLDAYLQNLGKRHARILGIDPPHFELMGIALLKTFHDRFGMNFTLELERCWARLYSYLANSILQFGIDPVLKIDKINNEWEDIYSGGARLDRTMTNLTISSTFESAKSMSIVAGPMSQTSKLRQPSSGMMPIQGDIKRYNLSSASSITSTTTSKKGLKSSMKSNMTKFGKSAGSGTETDEKCVIM